MALELIPEPCQDCRNEARTNGFWDKFSARRCRRQSSRQALWLSVSCAIGGVALAAAAATAAI